MEMKKTIGQEILEMKDRLDLLYLGGTRNNPNHSWFRNYENVKMYMEFMITQSMEWKSDD